MLSSGPQGAVDLAATRSNAALIALYSQCRSYCRGPRVLPESLHTAPICDRGMKTTRSSQSASLMRRSRPNFLPPQLIGKARGAGWTSGMDAGASTPSPW